MSGTVSLADADGLGTHIARTLCVPRASAQRKDRRRAVRRELTAKRLRVCGEWRPTRRRRAQRSTDFARLSCAEAMSTVSEARSGASTAESTAQIARRGRMTTRAVRHGSGARGGRRTRCRGAADPYRGPSRTTLSARPEVEARLLRQLLELLDLHPVALPVHREAEA